MSSVDTSGFAEASKREHELNHRQREILDLLVRGKTNGEIAEQLDMTLDGAKWNVSEILTKLGLGTREEAAEYWRWRRGGVRRLGGRLRGLFSPVVGKLVLGSAAAAAAAVVVFAAFGPDEDETGALEPFYLEAAFAGLARDEQTGASSIGTLRWWFQDRDRQRVEYIDSGVRPTGPTDVTLIADGSEMLVLMDADPYNPGGSPGYLRVPLRELPNGPQFRPWLVLGAVGPPLLPMSDINDFEAQVELSGSGLAPRGVETVLGRTALVRERLPVAPSEYRVKFWVDETNFFILRTQAHEGDEPRVTVEVTELQLDVQHSPDLFELDHEGYREVTPADTDYERLSELTGMSWMQANPGDVDLPEGMFRPAIDGWTAESVTFRLAGIVDASVHIRMSNGERRLTIRQDYDEQHSLGVGLDTPVRGGTGRMNRDSSGNTLAFWEDGVRVELTSPDLTHEELVAIADSLER